jgi:acetamidase/formamidase
MTPLRAIARGVWTRDVSDNQVGPDSDASALAGFDWDRAYPLTGPIGIRGAQPGDTLETEILDVHTQGWGSAGVGTMGVCPASATAQPVPVYTLMVPPAQVRQAGGD